MVKKRLIAYVSPTASSVSGTPGEITWRHDYDGAIKLEEVTVAYDSQIQATGTISLSIGSFLCCNAVDSPNSNSSFGFQNMAMPIEKGALIRVNVANSSATSGKFQLLVHAYEDGPTIEDILLDIGKMLKQFILKR